MVGASAQPARIAIDWGSSSFRAFLLDGDGTELARVETDDGILVSKSEKPFSNTLQDTCGKWYADHGPLPTIMSGMVGSRNGWVETPYVGCPSSIDNLTAQLVAVPGAGNEHLRIVPGVSGPNAFGDMDVMRGEEIQAFGALAHLGLKNALVCLPGTHSKWCQLENGVITSLTTFMTGEMFALIRAHSSIGPLVAVDGYDEASFKAGLAAGKTNAGLLNNLFGVRAQSLLGNFSHASASSYLSGLCIGQEIVGVGDMTEKADQIILVGNEGLNERYSYALAELGIVTTQVKGEAAFLSGIAML